MVQATRKKDGKLPLVTQINRGVSRGLREGALLVLGAIALYLLISLMTYQPTDPGWSRTGVGDQVKNNGGVAGAWFADVFLYIFGYFAYLFPIMVAVSGLFLYKEHEKSESTHLGWIAAWRSAGCILTMMAGSGLATLRFSSETSPLPLNSGGILGEIVAADIAVADKGKPHNRFLERNGLGDSELGVEPSRHTAIGGRAIEQRP